MATALESAMDKKGWGPEELARQSGVNDRTIYRYLSEKPPRKPRRSVLSKLARALGAPGLIEFSHRPSAVDLEDQIVELEERVDQRLLRIERLVRERLDGDPQAQS